MNFVPVTFDSVLALFTQNLTNILMNIRCASGAVCKTGTNPLNQELERNTPDE